MPNYPNRCRVVGFLALALVVAVASSAAAEVDGALRQDGWREVAFEGKQPNRFTAIPAGVSILSDRSASLIYRTVEADLGRTPCLAWRWKVDEAAPATDLARKGGDDRSIALWVGFRFDEATASVGERLSFAAKQAMTSQELPGRTLLYVWGGVGRGWWQASPYMPGRSAFHVLRSATAPALEWLSEKVNLFEDHRAAFGALPTTPVQIAVSSDTDDTATTSRATVADIGFLAC